MFRRRHGRLRICLHDEVPLRARNAVLVWAVMDNRNLTAKIIVGRWTRGYPLQRSRIPGIVARFFTLLHAPEQINYEQQLRRNRDESSNGNKLLQRNQPMQEIDFRQLRVTAGMSGKS